tara:strand:- start:400 stop:612 length:213 start_codon:yes stop_codon:yes gene_type:complete
MNEKAKSFEEAQKITQPVIYVGVDRQEARGFHKVILVHEDKDGLQTSESHLSGEISVQMVNGVLKVFVKN